METTTSTSSCFIEDSAHGRRSVALWCKGSTEKEWGEWVGLVKEGTVDDWREGSNG